MDILQDLHAMHIVQQEAAEPRRKRKFKNRTCAVFFEEMSDFEFLRNFRFTKDAVKHLTALLGIIYE